MAQPTKPTPYAWHPSHTPRRVLSERVPAEVLSFNPLLRSRLLEFIRDTYGLLRQVSISSDAYWESAQVRTVSGDAAGRR